MGEESSIQQRFASSIEDAERDRPRVHLRGRRRPRQRHASARRVHHRRAGFLLLVHKDGASLNGCEDLQRLRDIDGNAAARRCG